MVSSELANEVAKLLGERARNYLITGGSGFVGSHLARCLAEAGNAVTVLSRNRIIAPTAFCTPTFAL